MKVDYWISFSLLVLTSISTSNSHSAIVIVRDAGIPFIVIAKPKQIIPTICEKMAKYELVAVLDLFTFRVVILLFKCSFSCDYCSHHFSSFAKGVFILPIRNNHFELISIRLSIYDPVCIVDEHYIASLLVLLLGIILRKPNFIHHPWELYTWYGLAALLAL